MRKDHFGGFKLWIGFIPPWPVHYNVCPMKATTDRHHQTYSRSRLPFSHIFVCQINSHQIPTTIFIPANVFDSPYDKINRQEGGPSLEESRAGPATLIKGRHLLPFFPNPPTNPDSTTEKNIHEASKDFYVHADKCWSFGNT